MIPFSYGINMFSGFNFLRNFSFPSFGSFSFSFLNPLSYVPQYDLTFGLFGLKTEKQPSRPTITYSSNMLSFLSDKTKTSKASVTATTLSPQNRRTKHILKSEKDGYGKPFLDKVKLISKDIGCDYRDLLAIMYSESGIDSRKPCSVPGSSAVGLIQFTKTARQSLGVTREQLIKMSPIQQLDYVKKYYMNWRQIKGYKPGQKLSAGELYALTYTPGYLKSNSNVLSQRGMEAYNKNKGLDLNKDGIITVSDLSQRISRCYVSDNSFLA